VHFLTTLAAFPPPPKDPSKAVRYLHEALKLVPDDPETQVLHTPLRDAPSLCDSLSFELNSFLHPFKNLGLCWEVPAPPAQFLSGICVFLDRKVIWPGLGEGEG